MKGVFQICNFSRRGPSVTLASPLADDGGVDWACQIGGDAHARLLRALWSDTAFLAGLGVMDYSLLVGIDKTNSTLVVGIIDFIRQVGGNLQCPAVQSLAVLC